MPTIREVKMRKSFAEKIREDFKPVSVEEKAVPGKARAKAFPGARLIPLKDIRPDPSQPRKKFDQEKLDELAQSVKSQGIIEPITVRFIENDACYQIVTGERRFRAAQTARLTEVPCIVKELNDQEVLTFQIIENLQREELSPVDEAVALKKLLGSGLTQSDISKLIGKSQPYVSQSIKILDLPESILKETQESGVSKEHLLQLSKAENPEALWQDIRQTGKTAKEVKQQVTKNKTPKDNPKLWTWKPEDKAFTITIKFKKKEYGKEDLVRALKTLLTQVAQMDLFDERQRKR